MVIASAFSLPPRLLCSQRNSRCHTLTESIRIPVTPPQTILYILDTCYCQNLPAQTKPCWSLPPTQRTSHWSIETLPQSSKTVTVSALETVAADVLSFFFFFLFHFPANFTLASPSWQPARSTCNFNTTRRMVSSRDPAPFFGNLTYGQKLEPLEKSARHAVCERHRTASQQTLWPASQTGGDAKTLRRGTLTQTQFLLVSNCRI